MSPKRIVLYTAAELKAKYPDAYERALQEYQDSIVDIPWQDETIDSLKKLFKACSGISLRDWSIGAYSYSSLRVEFDQDEAAELTGARAVAWLENNLYSRLRIRNNAISNNLTKHHGEYSRLQNLKYNQSYRSCGNPVRPYTIGMIPPCPLTGYCADDDYIEALNKAIKSGETLKEAFENLASVASHLLELDYEQEASEEGFLDSASINEWQYTHTGQHIY